MVQRALTQEGGECDHFWKQLTTVQPMRGPLGQEPGLLICSAVTPPQLPALPCDKVWCFLRWLHCSMPQPRSEPGCHLQMPAPLGDGAQALHRASHMHPIHSWSHGNLMTCLPHGNSTESLSPVLRGRKYRQHGWTCMCPLPSPQGSPSCLLKKLIKLISDKVF